MFALYSHFSFSIFLAAAAAGWAQSVTSGHLTSPVINIYISSWCTSRHCISLNNVFCGLFDPFFGHLSSDKLQFYSIKVWSFFRRGLTRGQRGEEEDGSSLLATCYMHWRDGVAIFIFNAAFDLWLKCVDRINIKYQHDLWVKIIFTFPLSVVSAQFFSFFYPRQAHFSYNY